MNAATLSTTAPQREIRLPSTPPKSPDPYAQSGDGLFEVIKGKRVEKHLGVIETLIASFLQERLSAFCRERQLGISVMETSFAIPGSGNDRKPDVAFVSVQTWAANRPIPRVNAWAIAPDLAIEVISPTDKAFDVIDKVREYFAGGVRQIWHVYSNVEQVFIFDSPHTVRILNRADELSGDPLVPGFRLALSDLFPISEPTP